MSRIIDEPTIPSEQDAHLAREASRALREHCPDGKPLEFHVESAGGVMIKVPATAAKLLKEMLIEMGAGHAVTLVLIETEITTQLAADLLNVSRPFVVGLIDKGELPARMVGTHRRVRLEDVLAYKRRSKTGARAALKEMVAISQELGLE